MLEKRTVYTKDGTTNPGDPLEGASGYEIEVDMTVVKFRFLSGETTAMTRTVAETHEKRGLGFILVERPGRA